MAKRSRRNYYLAFKSEVALAAVEGERTLADLVEHVDAHPNQIQNWKLKLVTRADDVIGGWCGRSHRP